MLVHPVAITPDARQDLVDLFQNAHEQVTTLTAILGALETAPRGRTPIPDHSPPRYSLRLGDIRVIYEVPSTDPEKDGDPGAPVTVLNLLESRGREINAMAKAKARRQSGSP